MIITFSIKKSQTLRKGVKRSLLKIITLVIKRRTTLKLSPKLMILSGRMTKWQIQRSVHTRGLYSEEG